MRCDSDGAVIGYYSLCMYSLECDSVPPEARFANYDIPAVLLARLAVHEERHGEGVGLRLLLDAMSRAVLAGDAVAAKLLVVHALHERAANFYAHYGFKPTDADPLTMYLALKDVRATLKEAGLL